jgi:DNA-directed RNA polymerase specialized sigma24 family protein
MSAALQLPILWAQATARPLWPATKDDTTQLLPGTPLPETPEPELAGDEEEDHEKQGPSVSLAFYRRHTENLLRRYLYVSMAVGRTPSVMNEEPIRGGRCSHQRLRTFEEAVVFVLDIENCLGKLSALDRTLLSRIILQEYTQQETSEMIGMSLRAVIYKLHQALDRTTSMLLDSGLLELPKH